MDSFNAGDAILVEMEFLQARKGNVSEGWKDLIVIFHIAEPAYYERTKLPLFDLS